MAVFVLLVGVVFLVVGLATSPFRQKFDNGSTVGLLLSGGVTGLGISLVAVAARAQRLGFLRLSEPVVPSMPVSLNRYRREKRARAR